MAPGVSPSRRCGNQNCPKHGHGVSTVQFQKAAVNLESDTISTTTTASSSNGSTTSSSFEYLHRNGQVCTDPNCKVHGKGNGQSQAGVTAGSGGTFTKSRPAELQQVKPGETVETSKTKTSSLTLRLGAPKSLAAGEPGNMNNNITTNITHNNNYNLAPAPTPTQLNPEVSSAIPVRASSPRMFEDMRREHSAKENAMLQAITIKQNEEIESLKKQVQDLTRSYHLERQARKMVEQNLMKERAHFKKKIDGLTETNKMLNQKLNIVELRTKRLKRQASENAATASKWKGRVRDARQAQKELEERQEATEKLCKFLGQQLKDGRIKMNELKKAFGTSFSEVESDMSTTMNTMDTTMLELIGLTNVHSPRHSGTNPTRSSGISSGEDEDN